jgi:hypothetical protein
MEKEGRRDANGAEKKRECLGVAEQGKGGKTIRAFPKKWLGKMVWGGS